MDKPSRATALTVLTLDIDIDQLIDAERPAAVMVRISVAGTNADASSITQTGTLWGAPSSKSRPAG